MAVETVAIVGIGRMGGALAIALSHAGFDVDKLVFHSREPEQGVLERIATGPSLVRFDELSALDSDIILLAPPDTELDQAAKGIAERVREESIVLHTSGALSSKVLASVAASGAEVGSMHPLVSVSDPVFGAGSFAGAYFCLEGMAAAVEAAKRMVRALAGTSFSIDTSRKPLYHASAVLASGHVTALFSVAVRTLSECGVAAAAAKEILIPLLNSSVSNLAEQRIERALTGPFARADADAVDRHLAAFESAALSLEKTIYLDLAAEAVKLAEINGADAAAVARLRDLIKLAQASAK